MDAISYGQAAGVSAIDGWDAPPVLIAGSSEACLARAIRSVEALGLRIAAAVPIENAEARISQQAAASAVWLELDGELTTAVSGTIAALNRDAMAGRYAAVVAAGRSQIDDLFAEVAEPVHLLIDADDGERASTLSLALALHSEQHRANDVAADRSAERLRQLSDEVSRIAATLSRLSAGPSSQAAPPATNPAGAAPIDVPVELVRNIIRARRVRTRFFREDLFADPAWDMLLDLLQAELAHVRVPVSSLCIAAAVPATTALRWLKTMVREGLFVRREDQHDQRRVFVELAPQTSAAMRQYFAEVGNVGGI